MRFLCSKCKESFEKDIGVHSQNRYIASESDKKTEFQYICDECLNKE